jgi:hypothetical protein
VQLPFTIRAFRVGGYRHTAAELALVSLPLDDYAA